jgi:hypothetical protein
MAGLGDPGFASEAAGRIEGVVVNGAAGGIPAAGVEVVLRAGEEGSFVPVGQTVTDEDGRFAFEEAPIAPGLIYLPGANRDGVHYPGPRLRLSPQSPTAQVRLTVYDAITAPSPLIAAEHQIEVQAEPGVLQVTETVVVSNPTQTAYVGQAAGMPAAITLRLSIPAGFERVTFYDEFHGRHFYVIDGHVVTDIPWPPGERTLKFTYRLPAETAKPVFRRKLDLPTQRVRLVASGDAAEKAASNLPRTAASDHRTAFESTGERMSLGEEIHLQFGAGRGPWSAYARAASLAILAALVLGTGWRYFGSS